MLGVQDPVVADFAQQQGPQQFCLWPAKPWPSGSALGSHSSHLACINNKKYQVGCYTLYSEQSMRQSCGCLLLLHKYTSAGGSLVAELVG